MKHRWNSYMCKYYNLLHEIIVIDPTSPKQMIAGLSDSHLDILWTPYFMDLNIIKGREILSECYR